MEMDKVKSARCCDEEIWKPIEGFESLYEVSNMGNVRNKRGHIIHPAGNGVGYLKVVLYNHGSPKNFYVHRLVAKAFVPNPRNVPIVNHLDESRSNNRSDNLEWVTHKENINYGTANQRYRQAIRKYWDTHECKHNRPVRCVETGEVFKSMKDAAEAKGLSKGNIHACLKGCRKTAGGYHWKDYEKENR